jgi:hypothetical protein
MNSNMSLANSYDHESDILPKQLIGAIDTLNKNDRQLLNSTMQLLSIHHDISVLGSYQINLIMGILVNGFIEHCIDITEDSKDVISSSEIYNAFIRWLNQITINKEIINYISCVKFAKAFGQKFDQKRISDGKMWIGIKLKDNVKNISFVDMDGITSCYMNSNPTKRIFGRVPGITAADMLDLSHNDRLLSYHHHEKFDYLSVILDSSNEEESASDKHYDIREQLSGKYQYLTELVITLDNIDDLNDIKLSYGPHINIIFTKNQLKLYNQIKKQIIFKNESLNNYIIKLPFWFSRIPQTAICLERPIKCTLDIRCDCSAIVIVEAYVVELDTYGKNDLQKYLSGNTDMEALIEISYEKMIKYKPMNHVIKSSLQSFLPIKEIAWYYSKKNKECVDPIVDSVELLVDNITVRKYTSNQLTGTEQFMHLGKQIPGLYYISFAHSPQLYQPTGTITLPGSKILEIKHNFSNQIKTNEEIQINYVIFGYNVIRMISNLAGFAYSQHDMIN